MLPFNKSLYPSEEIRRRIWDKVDILDGFATDEDCWLWTGAKEKRGYGSFGYNRKTIRASRLFYLIYKGDIPEGMQVCHKCDNKLCVNPSHLFLGSAWTNTKDMFEKGRSPLGENHPSHKLSNEEVLKVFELKEQGYSQTEIAKMFGVCQPYISRLTRGLRRKRDNDKQVKFKNN